MNLVELDYSAVLGYCISIIIVYCTFCIQLSINQKKDLISWQHYLLWANSVCVKVLKVAAGYGVCHCYPSRSRFKHWDCEDDLQNKKFAVKFKRNLPCYVSFFQLVFPGFIETHQHEERILRGKNSSVGKYFICSGPVYWKLQSAQLFTVKSASQCTSPGTVFSRIKQELSVFTGSLLRSFFWASGEGEGRAACCSGGCITQSAGAAPEGPGWVGAEAAGLLPGRVGQGPSHLPRGGQQVQVSDGAAGLSLIVCFKKIYSSISFNALFIIT